MVARLATRRGRVRCLARAEGTRRCGAGTGSIGHVRAVGVPLLQRPAAVTADSAPPTSDVAIWQSSPSTHNPAAPRRRSKSQPRAVEQDAMRRKDPSFASLSTTSARVFDGPGGCWLIEKQQRLPRRIAETKSSNTAHSLVRPRKPPGGPGAWRPLSISSNQSWRTRRRATLRSHAACARQSQPSAGRYALPSQIYARATGPRDLCDHPPAHTTPLHERMKVVIMKTDFHIGAPPTSRAPASPSSDAIVRYCSHSVGPGRRGAALSTSQTDRRPSSRLDIPQPTPCR